MTASQLPVFRANAPLDEQLTASRMNAIVDYLRQLTPKDGTGTRIEQTPYGSIIHASSSGGGGAIDHPWKVRRATKLVGETVLVGYTVRIGVLEVSGTSVVPTIDAVPMSADYNDNFIEVPIETPGFLMLKLTVDDTDPYAIECSAAEITFEEPTEPDNTSTERYIRIAAISTAGAIAQEKFTTINCARAGDFQEIDNLRQWSS